MAETEQISPLEEAVSSFHASETEDRRFFPKSEKDEMPESDFGDPSTKSFPIKSPQDVINAAMNLGRTKGDQVKIKARIKAIAKRKGYPLPKSWSDEEGGESEKSSDKSDKSEKEERMIDSEITFEQALEALYRRYYSQTERESMDEADFAGPHKSFPIKTQQDVHNAASLIGHADNPGAVKSRIKAIAKKKGFSLPKSWENEDGEDSEKKEERAMKQDDDSDMKETASKKSESDDEDEDEDDMPPAATKKKKKPTPTEEDDQDNEQQSERAVTAEQHDSYSGSHSHTHTHGGSTHSHDHSHSDDSSHKHSHPKEAEKTVERSAAIHTSDRPAMYMPFTRVDAAKREVIGQATAEIPDSYGTIFAYYPAAWEHWRGNIREQHDPKKAVGKRIQHFLNPDTKSVDLHVRVSRGAQDTWMKVEDDVLTGFSLSVIPDTEFGNNISRWPKKEYEGKQYPYLPRYSIAEVSLVDNPSCPNCNIQIVRADGFATDILDLSEEEMPIERLGARMSNDTMAKMHKGIKSTLHSAMTQMENCNCSQCQKAIRTLDPDKDGDIDLGGLDDPDKDAKQLGVDAERMIVGLIERSLQPVYSRLQKIAGTLSRSVPEAADLDAVVSRALVSAFDAFDSKLSALPTQSSFDELRAELSTVKAEVEKIADQPMPGGPIMNANSLPAPQQATPAEKRLATDPPLAYQRQSYGSVYDAIATMSRQGKLDTTDKQVDAMTEGLIAQRRR